MGDMGLLDIDVAIFADTQGEPDEVYRHLDMLQTTITSFPIYRVSIGSLEDATFSGGRAASIPFFLKKPDGTVGMGRRQCTNDYKIQPVYKKVRDLLGLRRFKRPRIPKGYDHAVNMIMGITTDEALRMRRNHIKWIINVYPFIDELNMNRDMVLS